MEELLGRDDTMIDVFIVVVVYHCFIEKKRYKKIRGIYVYFPDTNNDDTHHPYTTHMHAYICV